MMRHIACCTDFSENAEAAFEAAVEMAVKFKAQLHLLHVLPPVVNSSTSGICLPTDILDIVICRG